MRMIPPRPHEDTNGSERKVFTLLAQLSLGQDAVALSSLNLAENEYQRWGEIDFFLVWPSGMLAIEVKGGTVSCKNGIWRFEDRWGRAIEKAISPIAQAQRGYSSLFKNYLESALPKVTSKAVTGFCALFPGTDRRTADSALGGPEMPEELVGTEEDCRNPAAFRQFIERVIAYWAAHKRGSSRILTSDDVKSVVSTLRPSFDRVAPLSLSLKRIRDEQYTLTADQYRMLDYLETAPRIVCTGGAGSGKTFIAAECLRRETHSNVVLVTGTSSLAGHLRALNIPDPSRIFSYEEIKAQRRELQGRFSTLIVDEGQQITTDETIEMLGELLDKPFNEARWRWFADPNHQVSSTSRFDLDVQTKLESWATVRPTLRENCRNTPQIMQAVEFVTGAAIGSTRVKGKGPEVKYAKAADLEGLVDEAAKQITDWTGTEEISPGDIVLLSPLPVHQSSIPRIADTARLGFQNWKPGWDRQSNYPRVLGASTIEDFRGIEAPFVILCDFDGDPEELAQILYLGMTRANFGLFVACAAQAREQLAMHRVLNLRHKS